MDVSLLHRCFSLSLSLCFSVKNPPKLLQEYIKKPNEALTSVAQLVEHHPVNQKVTGLIPGQVTCLGDRPGPQLGAHVKGNQ